MKPGVRRTVQFEAKLARALDCPWSHGLVHLDDWRIGSLFHIHIFSRYSGANRSSGMPRQHTSFSADLQRAVQSWLPLGMRDASNGTRCLLGPLSSSMPVRRSGNLFWPADLGRRTACCPSDPSPDTNWFARPITATAPARRPVNDTLERPSLPPRTATTRAFCTLNQGLRFQQSRHRSGPGSALPNPPV